MGLQVKALVERAVMVLVWVVVQVEKAEEVVVTVGMATIGVVSMRAAGELVVTVMGIVAVRTAVVLTGLLGVSVTVMAAASVVTVAGMVPVVTMAEATKSETTAGVMTKPLGPTTRAPVQETPEVPVS